MDSQPNFTQRMIRCRRRVLSGSIGACALLWLAAATPAIAAAAPAESYVVDACPVPVYVQLRVAAHADLAERSYRIESCGSGRDLKHVVPDGSIETLSLTGERGELDVRLQLQEGDKTLAYETLAVMPGASERTFQRIGHGDGPDVTVATTRDTYGDLLALHVGNVPARQITADIARVKGLHIDGIERISSKSRVTFNNTFSLRTVLRLLGEVSNLEIVRTGERDYVVGSPYRFPEGWKALDAAHEKASEHDQAAIEDKMLTLVAEPQRREDIQPFQLAALYTLRSWADDHHDILRAVAIHRRIVALLKLRSYDAERDVEYADALVQLADALMQHDETTEASTQLTQAIAIIERSDGPQSPKLTDRLLQQAALAERMGMKVSAHDQLARAIAVAGPDWRPRALLQLAAVHAEEGHYENLAATLDHLFPLLRKDGKLYEEDYSGDPYKFYDSVADLEDKAILNLRAEQGEIHLRHLIAVDTQRFGVDSRLIPVETYRLARNLLAQNKFDEAATQLERSVSLAAKQSEPPFFYADTLRYLATQRLKQHDFAGTAHIWQDMAALRAKVYGSHHLRVALALREVAMLDLLAGRVADAQDATRRAEEAESGKHASPPVPAFVKATDDLKDGLAFDLVVPIIEQLREDTAKLTALDEPLRVRNDVLATQFESYAETALHMQSDAKSAAGMYFFAASLRNFSRGRDHAKTQYAAKQAIELFQRIGDKESAEKLRKSYALDH